MTAPDEKCIFLCVPTHDGRMFTGTAYAILKATVTCHCVVQFNTASLLAHNFNVLLSNALNMKQAGVKITHFCMLHSDVVPDTDDWLNVLLREMDQHSLDVISSVVPIKDGRGLTSTAMCMDQGRCDITIKPYTRRITIHESMKMPTTFTGKDAAEKLEGWDIYPPVLLINTGCMVIDLRNDLVKDICFTIADYISSSPVESHPSDNGKSPGLRRVPLCEPEDWNLSRQLNQLGMKYAATRAVRIKHMGCFEFDSAVSWGCERDPAHFPAADAVPAAAQGD